MILCVYVWCACDCMWVLYCVWGLLVGGECLCYAFYFCWSFVFLFYAWFACCCLVCALGLSGLQLRRLFAGVFSLPCALLTSTSRFCKPSPPLPLPACPIRPVDCCEGWLGTSGTDQKLFLAPLALHAYVPLFEGWIYKL